MLKPQSRTERNMFRTRDGVRGSVEPSSSSGRWRAATADEVENIGDGRWEDGGCGDERRRL